MFNPGDDVIIKPDSKHYFGKYANTLAKVINKVTNNLVNIETYDGNRYSSPIQYLDKLTITTISNDKHLIENTKEDQGSTCKHENIYLNVLGSNLKFWVCPDCGKDWDYKEGQDKPPL